MSWKETYNYWNEYKELDETYKEQLSQMTPEELEDCFYKYIDFGTGGMRGVLGPGTNRLNKYIIRRANWGYAEYLNFHVENAAEKGVVIAYDNRHFSYEFAFDSAKLLASKGIKVYLFKSITPTPELSFAVRELKAAGGIVITASHNPPQYNGYKLYNETGCQLIPKETELVSQYIYNAPKEFDIKIDDDKDYNSLINFVGEEIDEKYISSVKKLSIYSSLNKKKYKIVFSPQHGTSYKAIKKLLEDEGYNLILVKEQCSPDPNFSFTKSPNPEDESAYELALEYASANDADMIITTDPDADRVGVAVKNG
ncbi:MAG: phospho-sugar mutase, partial [Tissierellia bacterium]|nr:phospho-sugar mutase [Tissierellia bacterium]